MVTPSEGREELRAVVDKLIGEAKGLLQEVITTTEASDSRAKVQKAHWTERHRLQVLLEAAEETRKTLPRTVVAPWFLAELRATLDVVHRWRQSPDWPNIEKSLRDKEAFNHTIAMLHVAEHLEWGGHRVQIVKEGLIPSPDLTLRATGGSQDVVVIECYQPSALCGKPSKLGIHEAESIVEKAMEKAKRQLSADVPGIIAICGYNQSSHNLRVLREGVQKRLSKTDRANLCGFWLIMLGIAFSPQRDRLSFRATRSAEFIRNPAYFGRVDIEAKVPVDHPNLIKGNLADIPTDALLSGNVEAVLHHVEPSPEVRVFGTKVVKLVTIQEPESLSRSIVHGRGSKVPPLFTGEGNINYQCGRCGVMLAERIWKLSLSNVVIQCPVCQSYNEIATPHVADYPTILIKKGDYYFSDAVRLKSGRCIRGE